MSRNLSALLLLLCTLGFMLASTSCATRPDGTRTFARLDKQQWRGLGKTVGRAVIKAAIPAARAAYERERQGLPPVDVTANK